MNFWLKKYNKTLIHQIITMAKAITLADLNAALKPIIEALNKLREDQTSNSSQVSETHSMITNLSVKMDTLEQTTGATLSEVSKPVTKKATGRKPAAPKKAPKKAPMKRGAKAKTTEAEDTEDVDPDPAAVDADDTGDVDADTADAEDADPAAVDTEDADPDADDASPADTTDTSKKSKKLPVKKAVVKKAVKKAAPKKVAAPRLNKMTIFKDEYKTNPSQFDKYLTAKVKKALESENEKWSEMSGDALANAQRTAYYHYMKDNHDDVLESLKAARAE